MLRWNSTTKSKGYVLDAMLGGTNLKNTFAVPYETNGEHTTPLVLLDQSVIENIEIMPWSGRKGNYPNDGSKYAPAKRGRKENLTKDNIPTIVEAFFNTMEAGGNTNRGSECSATCSSGHQVTHRSNNTGSHHARKTSSIANNTRDDTVNDTRDDTAGTTDQDVGKYNYVLPTFAENHKGIWGLGRVILLLYNVT